MKAGSIHHLMLILATGRILSEEKMSPKLVSLALKTMSQKWTMPVRNWASKLSQFAIMFEGRMPVD